MVQNSAGIPGCPPGRPLGLLKDNSTALVTKGATPGTAAGVNITLHGGIRQ